MMASHDAAVLLALAAAQRGVDDSRPGRLRSPAGSHRPCTGALPHPASPPSTAEPASGVAAWNPAKPLLSCADDGSRDARKRALPDSECVDAGGELARV